MGAEETSPPERTVREGDGVLKVVLATVWAFLYQKKCVGAKRVGRIDATGSRRKDRIKSRPAGTGCLGSRSETSPEVEANGLHSDELSSGLAAVTWRIPRLTVERRHFLPSLRNYVGNQ